MMPYLFQLRDCMFVKGNGFLFYAKNMGKNIGNIISKNLSRKDSHNLLDRA